MILEKLEMAVAYNMHDQGDIFNGD